MTPSEAQSIAERFVNFNSDNITIKDIKQALVVLANFYEDNKPKFKGHKIEQLITDDFFNPEYLYETVIPPEIPICHKCKGNPRKRCRICKGESFKKREDNDVYPISTRFGYVRENNKTRSN